MQGKMSKSTLRPPFRPPKYRQPSAAGVYLAGGSEKRKILTLAREPSGESRIKSLPQQESCDGDPYWKHSACGSGELEPSNRARHERSRGTSRFRCICLRG
jgi:hypothetical protein